MPWKVVVTEDFVMWFSLLEERQRQKLEATIGLLEEKGPLLGRPAVDTVVGSVFPNMKELRVRSGHERLRVLFAFDPDQQAVLLFGGNKTSEGNRWYREALRTADGLFRAHLDEIKGKHDEGLGDDQGPVP